MRIGLAALILLAWRPPRRGSADARAWRLAILLGAVMAVMNSLFYAVDRADPARRRRDHRVLGVR